MDFFKKKKEETTKQPENIPLPEPPKPVDVAGNQQSSQNSQFPLFSSPPPPSAMPSEPSLPKDEAEKNKKSEAEEPTNFQELLKKHMLTEAPPKPITLDTPHEHAPQPKNQESAQKDDHSPLPSLPEVPVQDNAQMPRLSPEEGQPSKASSQPSSESQEHQDDSLPNDLDLSLDNLDLSIPDLSFDDDSEPQPKQNQTEKSPEQPHEENIAAVEQAIDHQAETIQKQETPHFQQKKQASPVFSHASSLPEKKEAYLEASQAKEIANNLENVFAQIHETKHLELAHESLLKKEEQTLTRYKSKLESLQNNLLTMDKILFQKR